jgi:hypothetical protein
MNIIFTDTVGVSKEYNPTPALACIPQWYKNMESYMVGEKKPDYNGSNTGTIKRCMPVFDAIASGYIIYTYVDIYVSKRDGEPHYQWSNSKPLDFHPISQAPTHPYRNGLEGGYPKWKNPWGIKTPKGYSCLFTQPMHRESPFKILDGIVDTDTYTAQVNFPFVLNDPNFEGFIPAGTPMAQVIPFKRESWKMEFGGEEELKKIKEDITYKFSSFFDGYKNKFRKPKEYK